MNATKYTIRQVSIKLKTSIRQVQRLCKELEVPKINNRYYIDEQTLEVLFKIRQFGDIDATTLRQYHDKLNEINSVYIDEQELQEDLIQEAFTQEEYQEFQKRLIEYSTLQERITDLKNEINYLRSSLDKQSEQMGVMLSTFNDTIKSIRERNAIDYKNAKDND
jgi:hypothetical protein